jgi:hypothetical protein
MATRRYKVNASESAVEAEVTEEVGAATNSKFIELTVDLAATAAYAADGVTQRGLTREEVLQGLEEIKQHILKGNWPPA